MESFEKEATGTQKGNIEAPTQRNASARSQHVSRPALPRSSEPATPKESAATPSHKRASEHQQLNRSAVSKAAMDTSKGNTSVVSPGLSQPDNHPVVHTRRTPQTGSANSRTNTAASSVPQTMQQTSHPAVCNAPITAVPLKGSATASPHQTEPKQTPQKGWSSSSLPSAPAYEEQYPSLMEASKVPQRATTKTQGAPQAARFRQQQQQQSPDFYLKNKDKLSLNVIKKELTCDNYKEKFQHLLCWEEKWHERILTERCDGPNYRVTLLRRGYRPHKLDDPNEQDHVRYGLILSESEECGDIMSYAKQASEGAEIFLSAQKSIVVDQVFASVPDSEDTRSIVIALTQRAGKVVTRCYPMAANYYQIPDQLSVKFKLKHSYFQRLQQNVEWLPTSVIAKLMPTKSHFTGARASVGKMPMSYQQLKLDGGQLRALEAIACCNPQTPVLVSGPFGTGKTRLLARAAFQILQDKRNRVLVCAHHQASVDTFVEYFGEMKEDPNRPWWINFVRIIPRENYRSNTRTKFPQYFKTMRELGGKSYHLVVSTLGKIPFQFGSDFFTHILLDEGAQTREPELIRPLCLANDTTRIVIAGDHFQVGPQLLVLGDEAREYGLGHSILERLHKRYQAIGDVAQPYCMTLLTNYRCHSGILMLPSSLYYGSTLQCRVPEDTVHPNYPFPLVFLCTSLEQQATTKSRNELEVEILCNEVKTILKHWPEGNWGDKKPGDVCIMTPSADQGRHIRGNIHSREVEVLTAYDIQGRQYRAIFIGTFEALSKDGNPMNPTKSICDRYVFNTALTRAQSLVVVVGNPFALLRTESHMVERYGEQGRCWTKYIRRCLECKTFYPPHNSSQSVEEFQHTKECLYAKIYGSDTISQSVSIQSDAQARPNHHDSILVAYQRAVEEIPGCKKMKLILGQSGKDLNWDLKPLAAGEQAHFSEHVQMQEEGEVDVLGSSKVAKYTLRIQHYRKAEAVPFNAGQKVINVSRPQHRRGAFDGDIVQAKLFPDNPQGKYNGRIVRVLESTPNRRFVCTVFYRNSIVFCPIDMKNPLIVNLPRLSRAILNVHHKDELSDKLQSTDVVVFKADSLGTIKVGKLPEILTVIPLAVAKGMLFIVHVLHWNVQYRLPLGVVVGVVSKGLSFFEAERLLKVVHEVEFNDQEDTPGNPPADSQRDWSLPLYERALTIDPEQAVNLDDAISLRLIDSQEGASRYELAVHIVNAAKHITKESIEDRKAKSFGTSVYGGVGKTMHMLPPNRRRQFSLDPGFIRDVISIVATVVDDSSSKVTMEGSVGVRKAQLRSSIRLGYKSAQKIMERQQVDDEMTEKVSHYDSATGQPTLSETLQLFYKIAFSLRKERLRAAAAYSYEVDEPEERCCWQTHMMIAELMIWANSIVAERVYNRFTDAALVRRQGAPNEEEFVDTKSKHCHVLGYSQALQHHASQTSPTPPLLIPTHTLSAVREAIQSGDVTLLVNLLTSDHLYPQLAVAQAQLRSVQQRAEYHCTSSEENKADFHHYSLNLDFYTHFTSPMRRYIDIQLQRMLLTTLESTSSSADQDLTHFNRDSHKRLCLDLNSRNRNAKDFEKNMEKLALAQQYTCSSEMLEAFVVSSEKGVIELCFPDLAMKPLSFSEKKFHVRNLGSVGKSPGAAGTTGAEELMWQVKITSLQRDFQFETQDLMEMKKEEPKGKKGQLSCQDSLEIVEQGLITVRLEMAKEDQTGSRLRMENVSAIVSPLVIKLDPIAWGQVSKFVQNPSQGDLSSIREVITQASQDCSLTAVSEKPKCKFLIYHLKRSLARYDCIKVWMTYSTREAFLVPKLQLVELAPGVRICLEHNSHPAECFSDPQLRNASKPKYNDIREYVHLWEKVLLSEASEKSVKQRQPVVIQDVRLKWPEFVRPKGMDQDHFEVESKVVLELPMSFVDDLSEFFKIRVGDMVCVRYGCDPHSTVRSVFHMVVSNSPSEERRQATPEEHKQVQMKFISTEHCRVSERMKRALEEGVTCEMQIVTMSTSYQRVYKSLVKMKGAAERQDIPPLACRIALGNLTRNKLASHHEALRILHGDPLAHTLWDRAGPPDTAPRLNAVQIKAMELALTHEFQLIQGPPGTGKSETGAHIAYVFAMLNRSLQGRRCVLYCGPSNKSVDVVLKKLNSLNEQNPDLQLKLLRICSRAVERRRYPGPFWNKSVYQVEDSQYKVPDWASEYLLHDKIRQNGTQACQQLLALDEEFKRQSESQAGCIATAAEHKNYKLALKAAESEVLREHFDIVLCTCNETASGRMSSGKFFTIGQCIIDECGMAFEPESMAPISLCEHVVLLGDHKQLQPVIDYPPARDHGLARSLFQRYAKDFEGFCHILTVQYRMHDAICKFPSNCFYDRQLKTDWSAKVRTKRNARRLQEFWPGGSGLPLLFCNTVGKEGEVRVGTKGERSIGVGSKFNIEEAEKVVEIAKVLHHVHRVQLKEMAILTPYSAQRDEIKKLALQAKLLKEGPALTSDGIKLASINESQGDEYGIVILSTVRSQPREDIANREHVQPDRGWLLENLGFLTNEHQINVGITRSKYGLIIVGNETLLRYDDTWEKLLNDYKEMGCIVIAKSFPTKRDLDRLP